MQREYEERIIVYLHARLVDDSCQMLARYSPVRTRTIHLQILPLFRKQRHTSLFGHLCQRFIQLTVEEFTQYYRLFLYKVDEFIYILRRKLGQLDGLSIGCTTTSLHFGTYRIA